MAKQKPAQVRLVHPVADIFPMLAEDELAELAEDIKQHGQRFPIMVDSEGRIVDGRNRHAACELAGVEPWIEPIDAETDAQSYIVSANIQRRHLTGGQRAILHLMAAVINYNTTIEPDYADVVRSARQTGVREVARNAKVNVDQLSRALTILQYTPKAADAVLRREMSFLDAFNRARDAQRLAEEGDRVAERAERQLSELRAEAEDLAELVVENQLRYEEARAALEQRREDRRKERFAATNMLITSTGAIAPLDCDPEDWARSIASEIDPRMIPATADISPRRLRHVAAALEWLATVLEENNGGQNQAT